MKRTLFILFIFLSTNPIVRAEQFPSNRHLKNLLDSGEYFQFRDEYEKTLIPEPFNEWAMLESENLYFSAWYYFIFNIPGNSNNNIERLLNSKSFACPDSLAAELLQLHFQNDLRLFNYKSADSVCTVLLFRYPDVMDKETRDAIRNSGQITTALRNISPQTMERKGDLDIEYKRDLVNLIRIPVSMNGKTENYIFDTGANFSVLSESEAKRMGVKMLDANFEVTSSSKTNVESKLGVAEKMEIGNVTFRNVIFIILPDKSLKFAGGIYKIKGIIGLPIIALLGEIQIHKNKHFISPQKQTEAIILNLALEGNTPIVNVSFYGSAHPYIFDTGAAGSVFGNKFNTIYSDSLKNTKEGTAHVGGAGGMQKIKIKTSKNVAYSFGNKNGVLKNISIQLSGVDDAFSAYYGIVGEDIFMQWEVMVINFDKMFVEVE